MTSSDLVWPTPAPAESVWLRKTKQPHVNIICYCSCVECLRVGSPGFLQDSLGVCESKLGGRCCDLPTGGSLTSVATEWTVKMQPSLYEALQWRGGCVAINPQIIPPSHLASNFHFYSTSPNKNTTQNQISKEMNSKSQGWSYAFLVPP